MVFVSIDTPECRWSIYILLRLFACFADDPINHSSALKEDLVPAQEKLEWVTPKISLMEAEDTEGKTGFNPIRAGTKRSSEIPIRNGPSLDSFLFTTSNPATPINTNHRKGSVRTLF